VQFEIGEKLSYLGMQIEIRDDGTIVDMSFYVRNCWKEGWCGDIRGTAACLLSTKVHRR